MSTPTNPTPMATPYGTLPSASPLPQRKPVSLPRLAEMRERGEKITMLTAYDATFAAVADAAGVECILVGDSLGMVCQGLASTVSVTLDTMRYHTESVVRGLIRVQATAWVIGDLPFGSYHESKEQALRSAAVLMHAGAHMVKLEGGGWTAETVRFLVERGIPVCAHLGLTPQTVHALGGYRVQGRGDASDRVIADARAVQEAGAFAVVMEMVPGDVATQVTKELTIPTIGIGAGNGCDGQVLVWQDAFGLRTGRMATFVKQYADVHQVLLDAARAYADDVRAGTFPAPDHTF
jgi:3-methyl-2-oxobutanoate hydroxymethyltransferase